MLAALFAERRSREAKLAGILGIAGDAIVSMLEWEESGGPPVIAPGEPNRRLGHPLNAARRQDFYAKAHARLGALGLLVQSPAFLLPVGH